MKKLSRWCIGASCFIVFMFYLSPSSVQSTAPVIVPQSTRYRAVVLVLASHQSELYRNCRRVWLQYYTREPSIKVFFVYGQGSLPYSERTSADLVYEDIPETYNPGMILKTHRAIQEINAQYEYDFFIRTNLSTFWDFVALLEHLDTLPDTLCYSGHGPHGGDTYLSGTDTIVNDYMARQFGEYKNVNLNAPEDQAMGFFFHGVMGAPFLPSRIHFVETQKTEEELESVIDKGMASAVDHYRVKHNVAADRERIDWMAYKMLLKKIYDVDI